jgi:uncharacterized protein (TIGR02145 family)
MTSMIEHLSNDQIFISKLTEVTLANLGNENFGVNELAHVSGVSQHVLRRRLHVITNKTIAQFIRETRLQKALEMLQDGKVTSSEVAYKVGFSSPAYFNTCFHEYFGYPPGKVKKIEPGNVIEINTIQVTMPQEQKSQQWRIFLNISVGTLFLAVSVYLVYNVLLKDFSANAPAPFKNIGKSLSGRKVGDSPLTDIDGNVYKSVTIGTQVWMAENLKTTRYNDGTLITLVSDSDTWASTAAPGRCWYNNDSMGYSQTYGALYNYFAVDIGSNGGKNICPVGWHVPNASDWNKLFTYLGGEYFAGGKLKEAGTTHWIAPNTGATNESGFTALPSGGRGARGKFYGSGDYDGWWSSPESGAFRSLAWDRVWVYVFQVCQNEGFSIRCLKDDK